MYYIGTIQGLHSLVVHGQGMVWVSQPCNYYVKQCAKGFRGVGLRINAAMVPPFSGV